MSSETDDIPKDVLMQAASVVIMLPAFKSIEATGDATERIARAILAAKAEEREACALVAEAEAAGRYRQRDDAKANKNRAHARDFESMGMAAIHISSAIRKRGEA
jgi:hypothetical protein